MFATKRISIAAAIVTLSAPVAAQARPLEPFRSPGRPSQDFHDFDARHAPTVAKRPHQILSGADAQGAPASADEFPEFTPAARVRIVEVPSSGIDWTDASIGAGGTLVLVLLATATGLTVVRRRAVT